MKKAISSLLSAALLPLCACSHIDPDNGFNSGFPKELKQYVSPLTQDVRTLAVETQTIRYCFMASSDGTSMTCETQYAKGRA